MSILSSILSTGHVDPELLEALDDEQKLLLFCQMRAEQVRKWEISEAELERNGLPPRKKKQKQVKWLTGEDGDVWVWVMGDHETDKTIEQIIDEENREKAHDLALRELKTLSSDSDEDALMAQLGKLHVGDSNQIYDSLYDDDSTESVPFLLFQPPNYSNGVGNSSSVSSEQNAITLPSSSSNSSPFHNSVTSTTVSSFSTPQPQKAQVIRGERPPLMPKPRGYFAQFSSSPNHFDNYPQASPPPPPPPPPPIPPSPSALSFNGNDTKAHEGLVINGVRMRVQKGDSKKEEKVQKRESEIFQSLMEHRERLEKEAEAEEEKRKAEWEELQRKAREADAAMRESAQKAREKHKQLIRTSTSILPALKDKNASSLREAIKNLPRPPKPKSRVAIIEWFHREEFPRGTGLDPKTKAPAPWFHGIISREQAEILLMNKPTGSFLVRVSERIWGYTVSYASKDGSFKHFLVERIPEGYQFLGTNQVVHDQLFDLISYHETAPITAKGAEVLKWSVGQVVRPPDYADLIIDNNFQNHGVTYLNGSVIRTIPTTIINGTLGRF